MAYNGCYMCKHSDENGSPNCALKVGGCNGKTKFELGINKRFWKKLEELYYAKSP